MLATVSPPLFSKSIFYLPFPCLLSSGILISLAPWLTHVSFSVRPCSPVVLLFVVCMRGGWGLFACAILFCNTYKVLTITIHMHTHNDSCKERIVFCLLVVRLGSKCDHWVECLNGMSLSALVSFQLSDGKWRLHGLTSPYTTIYKQQQSSLSNQSSVCILPISS